MAAPQILVVEDSSIIARDIQRILRKLGYAVPSLAYSGKQALAAAEENRPDLVLMDIVLKGDMDGIETAALLRERFNIPVVYLTAYADESTLQRAKITEPFGYVLKPFQERELHVAIEMALYKHKAEEERRQLYHRLEEALARIKTLSGIIPICASCKKMRDDEGYWKRVEDFITEHSEAFLTHGICPDCAQELYPELADEDPAG